MKIRTDFVTNSSSSSFILGEPKNNTITVQNIIELIENFKQTVLKTGEELHSLYKQYYKDRITIKNGRFSPEEADEMDIISQELTKRHIENNNCSLSTDIIKDIAFEMLAYNNLQRVKDFHIQKDYIIVDLRFNESKEYTLGDLLAIDTSLQVFCSEESLSGINKESEDYLKNLFNIAYSNLGEIIVYQNTPMYPEIFADYLESHCTYGCNNTRW